MSIYERWIGSFKGVTCSDCDPEMWDDDDRRAREAEGEPIYGVPYVMAIPIDEPVPSHCPRCESYLSMMVVEDELQIHGHLIDRSIAQKGAQDAPAEQ